MALPALSYIAHMVDAFSRSRFDLASSNVPLTPLTGLDVDPSDLDAHPAALVRPAIDAVAAHCGVAGETVALSAGCTGANLAMAALAASSGRNPRILVERPGYEPMWQSPRLFGLGVDRFDRRWVEGRPAIDVAAVLAALHPDTSAVWLTNLHNPSGVLTPNGRLKELAVELRARGVLLYIDEVYLDFVDQPSAFGLADNVIVSNSLTKVYGLGGLRFGWTLAPPRWAAELRSAAVHLVGLPMATSLAYGMAALRDIDGIKRRALASLVGRREAVAQALGPVPDGLWFRPDAGTFGLVRLPPRWHDDLDFCRRLLDEEQVVVAPGSLFGALGHVRLGFASDTFDEGLERFVRFVR